jgi:thymidylate synthase
MNNLDNQYIALLNDILANGVRKEDRTGTGTISVFGRQIRHKMSEGFPLLTTKKMPFKTIATELLWFLNGDTNIKYLVDNGCNIWNGDAYKNYEKWYENMAKTTPFEVPRKFTLEEFVEAIKLDDDYAEKFGELGPIYGKQWRNWSRKATREEKITTPAIYDIPVDQIQNLINDLKVNPDSRRLMVNAWNVGEIDNMVLPPCHYGFQVYTRNLTFAERYKIYTGSDKTWEEGGGNAYGKITGLDMMDDDNVPTKAISLMWNQRSVDTFLGLPFNIASYGLLLEIIAREVNMVPDELIGNLGDVHLYSNHIEQAKEQIGGPIDHEKRHELLKEAMGDEAYENAIDELEAFGGGLSEYYDSYKIPYSTREPYQLPTLKIVGYPEEYNYPNDERLFKEFEVSDFVIENYQSHPTIKASLSN